jgi:hypothetical protein
LGGAMTPPYSNIEEQRGVKVNVAFFVIAEDVI